MDFVDEVEVDAYTATETEMQKKRKEGEIGKINASNNKPP